MPNLDLMPLGGVVAYLVLLVAIAEALNRFVHTGAEITRKIVHIGAGQVIVLAWWWRIDPQWILAASAAAALVALASYFLPILPSLNSVGRQSLGTFFYALSIGAIALLFMEHHPHHGVIGILVMAWGDGLAALVGQRWGAHPYQIWGNGKSWEGTATMALASFAVTVLVLGNVYGFSFPAMGIGVGVAIAATALEAISQFGIDNLTVPLGTAVICANFCSRWL